MTIELAIAIWGAVISTILGVIRIFENRSKIKIRLTHITFYETQEMYVTNLSKHPITVKEVGIRRILSKKEMLNADPFSSLPIFPTLDESADKVFPKRLEEGESIRFKFSIDMDEIYDKGRFQSFVKDTSGKEYSTKEVYLYNGKHHYEEGKVTIWSTHYPENIGKLAFFIGKLLYSLGWRRF